MEGSRSFAVGVEIDAGMLASYQLLLGSVGPLPTERCLGRLGRNFITQTFPVPATRAATKSRHVQAGVQIAVRPSLSCLACALQARLVAVSRTAGGFGPF